MDDSAYIVPILVVGVVAYLLYPTQSAWHRLPDEPTKPEIPDVPYNPPLPRGPTPDPREPPAPPPNTPIPPIDPTPQPPPNPPSPEAPKPPPNPPPNRPLPPQKDPTPPDTSLPPYYPPRIVKDSGEQKWEYYRPWHMEWQTDANSENRHNVQVYDRAPVYGYEFLFDMLRAANGDRGIFWDVVRQNYVTVHYKFDAHWWEYDANFLIAINDCIVNNYYCPMILSGCGAMMRAETRYKHQL